MSSAPLAQQAELGEKLVAAVIEQLQRKNFSVLDFIPVPKLIKTEDGYEFHLNSGIYTNGDSEFSVIEILELMLLSPQERDTTMIPQFEIVEWTVVAESEFEAWQKEVDAINRNLLDIEDVDLGGLILTTKLIMDKVLAQSRQPTIVSINLETKVGDINT